MATTVQRTASNFAVGSGPWKPLKGMGLFWAQFSALTKKNLLVRRRAWKTNVLLVAQAVLFVFLTWAIDQAVSASNQRRPAYSSISTTQPQAVGPIPDCSDNMFLRTDQDCYTLLYAPSDVKIVEQIITGVANNNNPGKPIPGNHIKGFANGSLIDEYLLRHPSTVIAAVEFTVDSPTSVGFSVMSNSSIQWFKGHFQDPNLYAQLPVQSAIEREIFKLLARQPGSTWNTSVAQFPHPSAKSPSAIANFLPTFFFASLMFNFVLQLHDLLHERESGARRLLRLMGLKSTSCWTSAVIFQAVLAMIEACLLVAFSYAFQFTLFTKNDFSSSFLLISLTSLSLTSFGFFVASFLRKAGSAVPTGFFLFVVAWVMLVVERFGFPYRPQYSSYGRVFFNLFPWSVLGKGIDDLAEAATGIRGGLAWVDIDAYCQVDIPSPQLQQSLSFWRPNCVTSLSDIYIILAIQTVCYLLLALYFENILPDENGTKRPFWYPLQPSYWIPSKRPNMKRTRAAMATLTASDGLDVDVQAEQLEMKNRCEAYMKRNGAISPSVAADVSEAGQKFAVEMYGLRKTYKRGGLFKRSKVFAAVNGNCFGIREGECFCLLGPNGAGKTTTIHCLTGVLPFTEGDALVYGTSIANANGLEQIRPFMGVCPQFDTGLWELLSGREHLNLFASIKGIPSSARAGEAAKLLEDVKLTEAANITAGAYSGGMKRRLSVAMALLGNPKIVYLDEPTTGLDPISRRHLWDLVDSVKQNRAIILTTHSMEEADILGDRIGIMVRGKLHCVGTSLRLKARFGSGYRVSVRVQAGDGGGSQQSPPVSSKLEEQKTRIKSLFMHRLGVKSVEETNDYVHFLVPYENEDKFPLMLAHVKSHAAELGVVDVQLRLTSLEEVFLNVARKAELYYAEAEGKYETLTLVEENIVIKVPIGADFIQSPGGQFYHVKWIQDESGALRLQDYWKDSLNSKLKPTTVQPQITKEKHSKR